MERTLSLPKTHYLLLMLLGSGLIALGSLVRIPFYPIPFTLQTLALFILGLTQSPRLAMGSVLCFLAGMTMMKPLWLVGPCGGYLIAFPIAAYLISRLNQIFHPFVAILCGQLVIYTLGFIWLIPFVGVTAAFMKGVAFFIPSGLFKAALAIAVTRWRMR